MYVIELNDNAKIQFFAGIWNVTDKKLATQFKTRKEAEKVSKALVYTYEDVKNQSWVKKMVKNGLDKKFICCNAKIIVY